MALASLSLSAFTREMGRHQRLPVTVETPAGEASSLILTEVRVVDAYGPLILRVAAGPKATVGGNAVATGVLPGKWFFALLNGNDSVLGSAIGWSTTACNQSRAPDGKQRGSAARASVRGSQPSDTPVPLPPEEWPLMVTPADIADRRRVARVNPNNLAATFGPGVRLKAVTLEITRTGVTKGRHEQILPWLGPCAERPLLTIVSPSDHSFEANFRQGNFIRRQQQ